MFSVVENRARKRGKPFRNYRNMGNKQFQMNQKRKWQNIFY